MYETISNLDGIITLAAISLLALGFALAAIARRIQLIYYHGTTLDAARQIQREGLRKNTERAFKIYGVQRPARDLPESLL